MFDQWCSVDSEYLAYANTLDDMMILTINCFFLVQNLT